MSHSKICFLLGNLWLMIPMPKNEIPVAAFIGFVFLFLSFCFWAHAKDKRAEVKKEKDGTITYRRH